VVYLTSFSVRKYISKTKTCQVSGDSLMLAMFPLLTHTLEQTSKNSKTKQDKTQDKTGNARQDKTKQDKTRQDKTRKD
jgi:hypothetical protein